MSVGKSYNPHLDVVARISPAMYWVLTGHVQTGVLENTKTSRVCKRSERLAEDTSVHTLHQKTPHLQATPSFFVFLSLSLCLSLFLSLREGNKKPG